MTDQTLEERIQKARDYKDIINLVNVFARKFEGGRFADIENMFALKIPGVRAEMLWGVYEGAEGIRKLYSGLYKSLMGENLNPGIMVVRINANPVIEIAGDGKTAKAVCRSLGHETWQPRGELQPFWAYGKRAFDFVKEDGKWRIWHYHEYGGFYTPYNKSWLEGFEHPLYPYPDDYPDEFKPDDPPTTYWMYKPAETLPYQPVPPEPYEIWDERTSY